MRFDVFASKSFDELGKENGGHGFDLLELVFDFEQVIFGQYFGVGRRFVCVVFEEIPTAEHQVVQACQRNEILDHRRTGIGAFAEP